MPFRANPFSQGVSISLRVRLFAGLEVKAQTYRSATGQLRYTASGDTVLAGNYRHAASESEKTFKRLRYVVRGRVEDEKGAPVEEAAVLVGEELVFTNTAGEFFVRRKTAAVLPLEVAIAEFLNPASFRVVYAPPTVTPLLDGAAPEIILIVGRN